MKVLRFVEKPDAATAQRYLDEGGYFWNSGMFVVRASVWLKALERFRARHRCRHARGLGRPQHRRQLRAARTRPSSSAIPSESVDYAVMEKCPGDAEFDIRMVPLDAGWSDLGAWDAVWQVSRQGRGRQRGGGRRHAARQPQHAGACHQPPGRRGRPATTWWWSRRPTPCWWPTAAAARTSSTSSASCSSAGRSEHTLHRQVHRPWGWYDSIDSGPRFQVKRIMVKPGASLSLQKHHHRAEHWIVVSGTAEVTNGDKVILLTENQSTYIPLGQVHRLANPGKVPLEIIEVQSGSYLGEDDIVRFEDSYGRG